MEMGALSLTSKLTLIFAICVGSLLAQVGGTPGVTGGAGGGSAIGSITGATQGKPLTGASGGGLQSSGLYIDALAFKSAGNCTIGTTDDLCVQTAFAAVGSGLSSIVDLSGYGSALTFSTNVFASLQQQVQPSNPLKCGTLRNNAGAVITANGPQLIPTCWRVENLPNRWAVNGGGPAWVAGANYPPCWGVALPCNTAVESTTATTSAANCSNTTCLISVTPSSGTPFTASMLWSHFAVCVSTTGSWGGGCVGAASPTNGCSANGQNPANPGSGGPCIAFGAIIAVNNASAMPNGCGSANCLLVAVPANGAGVYGAGLIGSGQTVGNGITITMSGATATASSAIFPSTGTAWNGATITINGTVCTIASVSSTTVLTLTSASCVSGSALSWSILAGPANASGINYVIWAPLITLGDFNETNINMGVQWEGGSVQTGSTQNLSTGGAAPVACANYNAQEESFFRFVQCLPQGTGKGVGLDIEGGSFNSGPYDNVIITFPGNCNTAASQGTGNPLAMVVRQNANSSYPRSIMNTTITSSGCNGGAGFSPLIDWESPSTLGPGIHIESGTGNNILVDVSDSTIICPVICPMIQENAQGTDISDINQTVLGATGTIVKIASGANQAGYTIRHIRGNGSNLLVDTATGCTITQAAEKQLAFYATTVGASASAPAIAISSSTTPGCQPQTAVAPASITAAYSNATSGFTSLTGMKMTVAPSSTLKMTCYVTYSMTGTTPTGPSWQFTGPASPTLTTISDFPGEGGTVPTPITTAAAFSAITNAGSLVSGQLYTDIITLMVQNSTTGGTVQLQGKPPSTSFTLAVASGSSYCQ